MRRIFLKLCLFFLPFSALNLMLAGLAWHSGEAMPVGRIVKLQQNEAGAFFGSVTESRYGDYKLAAYHHRQPEILILGNSLTLNLRSEFFTKRPGAIYNGSVGGWHLPNMRTFYQRLENQPEIIITLIDLNWFHADIKSAADGNPYSPDTDFDLNRIHSATVEMVHRLLNGRLSLSLILHRRDPLTGRTSLGLRALELHHGYRLDGSRQLGRLAIRPDHWTRLVQEELDHVAAAGEVSSASRPVHEPAFALLQDFLQGAKDDGASVFGVTTPRHFAIFERMKELGMDRQLAPIRARVEELFAAFGFDYHYFGDMRAYGASANEWYDGRHMSESNSLRMMLVLFERHQNVFDPYTDREDVRHLLESFTNPMDIFHELPPI
ncbi:MAG: hypothetical protein OXG78_13620 [Chloroflexi bacterium]|nr:hypothetical protein [Chloroflexota bacterium]